MEEGGRGGHMHRLEARIIIRGWPLGWAPHFFERRWLPSKSAGGMPLTEMTHM